MKKTLYLLLLLISISMSCTKDVNPTLIVHLEFSKSTKYDKLNVNCTTFSLLEIDSVSKVVSISDIQQWSGIELEYVLKNNALNKVSKKVLEMPHWELNLKGVKPYFFINIEEMSNNTAVHIPYVPYIELSEEIRLQKNSVYDITISVNTDSAFIDNGQGLMLDWSYVSATIVEK